MCDIYDCATAVQRRMVGTSVLLSGKSSSISSLDLKYRLSLLHLLYKGSMRCTKLPVCYASDFLFSSLFETLRYSGMSNQLRYIHYDISRHSKVLNRCVDLLFITTQHTEPSETTRSWKWIKLCRHS